MGRHAGAAAGGLLWPASPAGRSSGAGAEGGGDLGIWGSGQQHPGLCRGYRTARRAAATALWVPSPELHKLFVADAL